MRPTNLAVHACSTTATWDDFPEEEVWARFRAGDKKALAYFYDKYFQTLYNYGKRLSGCADLVEDCIQDLFIEFWEKRTVVRDIRNTRYYLMKCLRRRITKMHAASDRTVNESGLEDFELELSHRTHYLNLKISDEIRQHLQSALQLLSAKQKEALFLIYFNDLSYTEVASVMGINVKAVYNLMYKSMEKLKEQRSALVSDRWM